MKNIVLQQRGVLTLPKKIRENLDLQEGQSLKIKEDKGTIVLKPIKDPDTQLRVGTLDDLTSKITPENRHTEVDWGSSVGKEVW